MGEEQNVVPYEGIFTGQQIDQAIGAVLQKEKTWDGKQAKLTGTPGQVVGFDADGNAVPQEAEGGVDFTVDDSLNLSEDDVLGVARPTKPITKAEYEALSEAEKQSGVLYVITDDNDGGGSSAGIPSGGTTGQMLAKASNSDYDTEWVDPPEGGGGTAGVSSFKGRTGAVTPQDGDYTADMVGAVPKTRKVNGKALTSDITLTASNIGVTPPSGMSATNVQTAVTELFQSVSEGKALIASAVTDKGVATSADATFSTMAANISAIQTGGGLPEGVRTITLAASPPEGGTVSGGGYASDGMTCNAKAVLSEGYAFGGWKENGETVHSEQTYSFPVSSDRDLTADFFIPAYMAGRDWWESPLPSSANWCDIAGDNGIFVTVARSDNKAAYSTDGGKTWTVSTLPYSANWYCVAGDNGIFVAVAKGNKSAYSTDGGKTWTASTLPYSADWFFVAGDNGIFVAVANGSDKAAYSTDGGKTWTVSTLPSYAGWYGIAGDKGVFATVASDNKAAYSTDGGKTWTASTLPSSASWYGIAGDSGIFAAMATGSDKAAYSTDGGKTWTASTLPSSAYWYGIAGDSGIFVTVARSDNKSAYTTDGGKTWTASTLQSSANWYGVAGDSGIFATVTNGSDKAAYSFTGTEAPT